MDFRINKLEKQARGISDKRNEYEELEKANILDLALIDELSQISLSDDFAISQLESVEKSVNIEQIQLDEKIESNRLEAEETIDETDDYLIGLEDSVRKLEKMGKVSDLVDVNQELRNAQKMIADLESVKQMLDSDSSVKRKSVSETSSNVIEQTEVKISENISKIPEETTKIKTRNISLNNSAHHKTGVPYKTKIVHDEKGQPVEVVVPVFDSVYDTYLPEGAHRASDKTQFEYCNRGLYDVIFNSESKNYNPEIAQNFNKKQLTQIQNGHTPKGYTWHHDAEPCKMQLVASNTHGNSGHTGGRTIWGGGKGFR